MKRPDFIAIFEPRKASAVEVAESVLELFLDELRGDLNQYYARIHYDPDRARYFFSDEILQLRDRHELLEQLERDKDCMWSCDIDLGFAPAEIFPAVFRDVHEESQTTLLLDIEPGITKFVETEKDAQKPFVVFLCRVAAKIEASYFAGGPSITEWRPLSLEQLLDPQQLGFPYIIGWKPRSVDEQRVAAGLGMELNDVQRTTLGYRFLSQYPPP